MQLHQLEYFVEVARLGSINAASKMLCISQPSLSVAISNLERELHAFLFRRTIRGVELTDDGAEFLVRANNILDETRSIKDYFSSPAHVKTHFSVSSQHYGFVIGAFARLVEEEGKDSYFYYLRDEETANIIDNVSSLKSELGIIYLSPFNEGVLRSQFKRRDLVFHSLAQVPPQVVLSKNHPLAGAESLSFEDLRGYPYLSFVQNDTDSSFYAEEAFPDSDHRREIMVTDRAAMIELAHVLGGYTISSGFFALPGEDMQLVGIPAEGLDFMDVGYLCSARMAPSRLAQRFVRILEETLLALLEG